MGMIGFIIDFCLTCNQSPLALCGVCLDAVKFDMNGISEREGGGRMEKIAK